MILITLSHPDGLPPSLLARVGSVVGGVDVATSAPTLVECCTVDAVELDQVRAALRPFEAEVDILTRPLDGSAQGFRLFVADMDSTMVGCECLDELADYAGRKAEVAAATERAMRGELDFAASLVARVSLLAGLPQTAIAACLAERVRPNPGAATLVATLRAYGVRAVLVTGGFTAFAEPVGAILGFDRVVANRLEVADGRLTGRVLGPIVDAVGKRDALLAEAVALGGPANAVAIGDGANDIAMVEAAGLGLAYRPKRALAAVADGAIRHGDLTTVLGFMGIPSTEWTRLP